MAPSSDSRLELFVAQVRERFGIVPGAMELENLRAGAASGLGGRVDAATAGDDAAMQELVDLVTVHETHFFRHPAQFEAVRAFARARWDVEPSRTLSVLSAACATGEEAYTLAAALDAVSRERVTPPGHLVVGFDVSCLSVATACAGRYNRWSVRGPVPEWAAGAVEVGPERVEVSARLRALTRFEYGNLLDPLASTMVAGLAPFDVVFCRNALMYLGATEIERALGNLIALLAPGGLLVLSPVDPRPPGFAPLGSDPAVYVRAAPVPRAETERPPFDPRAAVGPLPRPAPSAPPPPGRPPPAWEDPTTLLKSVKALADGGSVERARLACAHLLRRFPGLAGAHWLAGIIELDGQDSRAAQRCFERAVALDQGFAMAHFGLATALSRDGRRAEARAALLRLKHLLAPMPAELELPGPEPVTCGWLKSIVEAQLRE